FQAGIAPRFELPRAGAAALLRPDGHVLLGENDRAKFGVAQSGIEGMEINGRRAVPVGFVPEVRLFTTAGFVLTDLENARAFLRLPPTHVTYLVCKLRPGADPARVDRKSTRLNSSHVKIS